jgi:prepilin-type N-terminal cleavage/methylation domain-containing protein
METPAGVAPGNASSPITIHSRSTSVLPRLALSTLNRLSLNFRPLTCPELVEWVDGLPRSPTPAERGRASAASRALALREGGPVTPERSVGGFTLVELLVVIGIIALLLALIVPAFTNIKSAGDVTSAVYGIQGLLENARTYAKANHTYVFVGFAEVDSSIDSSVSPQVTTGATPYGRVAVAVVASKDGTRQCQYTTSTQGSDWTANYSNGSQLVALGKLERYENLHFLVDFGSWTPAAHPNSNMARFQPTGTTYTLGNAASTSVTPFTWPLGSPLGSGQYQFNKVINFDPQGIARIATSTNADEIAQIMEIDCQQTHGTLVPPVPINQDVGNHTAIQIAPRTGAIRIYRP